MMLFDDFHADPLTPLAADSHPQPVLNGVHVLRRPLSAGTRGILIRLRGVGQVCSMVLRTSTMGPDQGYQTLFNAPPDWRTLNLLLTDFHPVGGVLRRFPRPEALQSYAIRPDDTPDLTISRVSFY